MTNDGRVLRLTVGDATLGDVGEGRARMSRHLMEALDLSEGEQLRVRGTSSILVRVLASAPDDEGLDILRLGAAERRRAGIEIGDVVEAERHDVPAARRVRVVLVGHGGEQELTAEDLRPELASQPIMAGDSVSVAPRRSRFDAQVNVLGITIAEVDGSSTECGAVMARVVETEPPGVVRIADDTSIEVETAGAEAMMPDDGGGHHDPVARPRADTPAADSIGEGR